MDRIPTSRSKSARSRPSSGTGRSNVNNTLTSYLINKDVDSSNIRPQSAKEIRTEYHAIPKPHNADKNHKNINNNSNQSNEYSIASLSSKEISIDTNERKNLNDSLLVLRPYTPEILDSTKLQRRFLPKSITDPLIINYDNYEEIQYKYKKPLTCPEEYIINSQKPSIFEKAAFAINPDYPTRVKLCRSFIERNRDRLWKLDIKNNLNKTPRTICNELVDDPNFMSRMIRNHMREDILKKSNSERIHTIMNDKHEYKSNVSQDLYHYHTLNTSRNDRKQKMEKLIAPELLNTYNNRIYRRGYDHAVDFGNFSKYNATLKNNKATTMNR